MALERSQDDKSTPLEDQHLATDFRVRAGEDWVAFWRLSSRAMRAKWRKANLAMMAQNCRHKFEDNGLGH